MDPKTASEIAPKTLQRAHELNRQVKLPPEDRATASTRNAEWYHRLSFPVLPAPTNLQVGLQNGPDLPANFDLQPGPLNKSSVLQDG